MHRNTLLSQLDTYLHRYPDEADTTRRFIAFVRDHVRCFERDCWPGHVTGSAWLLNPARTHLLLTHHKKLNMWLQLGGHSDGDADVRQVALREAEEESGLHVRLLQDQVLDIDIHEIPARKQDPAHYHYDVRFSMVATNDRFVVSSESMDLAWVPLQHLETHTTEVSILRMRDKWTAELAQKGSL